jgi:hypothetical protein
LVADPLFKIGENMIGWKKVKDTELARFMYPEYKEKEDGYILVPEPINLDDTTFAERIQIADRLLQYCCIKSKEEYLKIIDNIGLKINHKNK